MPDLPLLGPQFKIDFSFLCFHLSPFISLFIMLTMSESFVNFL